MVPLGGGAACAPMGARASGEDPRSCRSAAPPAASHAAEAQGLLLLGRARLKFFRHSPEKPLLLRTASG